MTQRTSMLGTSTMHSPRKPRLLPLPAPGLPIRDLERLWLWTACLYEKFDETAMADADWDLMAKELNDRRSEWSAWFRWALDRKAGNPKDWNVGSTASGVDYSRGIPEIIFRGLHTDPNPRALTVRTFLHTIVSHNRLHPTE